MSTGSIDERRGIQAEELAVKLLLIIPITTLFQSFPLFDKINIIVIIAVFIALLLSFLHRRYPASVWMGLFLLALLSLYDLTITPGVYSSINIPFYLPFWFVILNVFACEHAVLDEILEGNLVFIKSIVFVWCFLVGVSTLIPSFYHYSSQGGYYFGSIPGSVWRLMPAACFIQVLIIFCLAHDRKGRLAYFVCSLLLLYCSLMGGARTYFVLEAVLFLVFLRYATGGSVIFVVALTAVMAVGFVLFTRSGLYSKIVSTTYGSSSYWGYWGTVSNSRTIIWKEELEYFLECGRIKQLFGSGFDAIYEVNLSSNVSKPIWAHNDFLNIAISNGMAGIFLYLAPVAVFLHSFRAERTCGMIMVLIGAFLWLFPAAVNGCYTYTCTTLMFCFMPRAVAAFTRTPELGSQEL